ncbi:MAG: c-type cytochrome [Parvularculaceae bacterium]
MKRFKIPALLQAFIVLVAAYLILDNAFPPVMPKSVLVQYMIIIAVGVLLYYSFDDRRWAEFKAPIKATLEDPNKWPIRWAFVALATGLAGFATYNAVKPSLIAPVELRQVHPAPPRQLEAYGETFDLTTLENPLRGDVLETLKTDPDAAAEKYAEIVARGSNIYYSNCFFCHGDLLDGRGIFAAGLNPPPANFRDVGTIAQLQEAYLFWRITTGGPGLPKEGAPWNSAMPVWQEVLSEEEVWSVITFLYDHVGQVPRMWNQDVSQAVTAMKDKIEAERGSLHGRNLYELHCATCHGTDGAGDGPAADFVYPAPRDFTIGMFKYKTSPFKTMPPTDEDIFHTIKKGLPGTAMPAWESVLNDAQIRELIKVVKGFDLVGTWAPEDAPDADFNDEGRYMKDPLSITERSSTENPIPFTEDSVAKGKKLFERTCAQCHGMDGRGNPAVDKRLKDEWGVRIWPRDLTKPWTWRVTEIADNTEETIRNIYTRLSVGIPGTPMPAHADKLSEEERWHIANYVYTLRNYTAPLSREKIIEGLKVDGELPKDVHDPLWESARPTTLMLLPNIMKGERLFKALNDALTVRLLYNEGEIAFLLEIDDRTHSLPGDPDAESTQDRSLELHSDALAVQLPTAGSFRTGPTVEKPLFRHGDRSRPTVIWYWNAGSAEPPAPASITLLDGVGDDKQLHPRANDHSVSASGEWVNGRWRVMMTRSRQAEDPRDISFNEGAFVPISFASWDGSNGEIASKHSLTPWYWMILPSPVDPVKINFPPIIAAFFVFFAGLVVIRSARRRTVKRGSVTTD